MKIVPFTLMMLLFISCNQETPPLTVESCLLPGEVNEDASIRDCIIPERSDYPELEVNAALRDFSFLQENKMQAALNRLKIVLSSEVFKERVLAHTFQGRRSFNDNNGLSNFEIYETLMEGAETLDPVKDSELDIDITLYFKDNNVIGYTYPSSHRIWVNNKFFAQNSYGKVAANVVHEWTHKLGFGHDFQRTRDRSYSVPYAVGTIVRELIDQM